MNFKTVVLSVVVTAFFAVLSFFIAGGRCEKIAVLAAGGYIELSNDYRLRFDNERIVSFCRLDDEGKTKVYLQKDGLIISGFVENNKLRVLE